MQLNKPQWGVVCSGTPMLGPGRTPYRPTTLDYERWSKQILMSETAKYVLEHTERYKEFFAVEKDLALIVPKAQHSEFFYSLKNGFTAPNCPAEFIYFAKVVFGEHRVCNLIAPSLPSWIQEKVVREGYFGAGYTAKDVICNFVTPHYRPITEAKRIVKCGDWYEAYVPETDMVTALPIEIGEKLTDSDLDKIHIEPGHGLCIDGKPLYTFCACKGVSKSTYDLRGIV